MNRPLTVGAMFAGYGGLDLGLSHVFDTDMRWCAEIEPAPSKVLAARWPDVPNLGDVTAIDWASVEPVDVITGGSPCQDLSHAGKRAGMRPGTRSGLWAAMCRAIDELRPGLVVWENVRGALSAEASCEMEPEPRPVGTGSDGPVLRALGRVLGDLADLGYDAGWCGLRAADVGAPHGRFRVFVVAWPAVGDADEFGRERFRPAWGRGAGSAHADHDVALKLMPTPDAAMGDRGPQSWASLSVVGRQTNLNDLPLLIAGDPAQRGDGTDELALLPTPVVNDMGAGKTPADWDAWTDRLKSSHANGNGHGDSLSIEALRLLPSPTAEDAARSGTGTTLTDVLARDRHGELSLLPTPTTTQRGPDANLTTREGAGPNLHNAVQLTLLPTPQVGRAASGETYAAREGHQIEVGDVVAERVIGVASYFGPYTAAVRRWEQIHGHRAPAPTESVRRNGLPRLSPRFVEWMMGVPPGWVDVPGVSHNGQLRMLGNGVVPAQAAAAIAHLLDVAASVRT